MDSIAQGQTAAEAQLDALWSIAEDDLYSQFGHAAIAAMTPDERSQKIADVALDVAMELIFLQSQNKENSAASAAEP